MKIINLNYLFSYFDQSPKKSTSKNIVSFSPGDVIISDSNDEESSSSFGISPKRMR